MSDRREVASGRKRIVIVGAGFGGLWAARELAGEDLDVLLVDRNNFHTFYPLLYQVGASELEPADIARPVRAIFGEDRGVDFLMAEVTGVDLSGRRVLTDRGEVAYDRLVLAPGSTPRFFGIPGAEDHAFPLRSMEDALTLRNHVLARFEAAVRLTGAARERALRFVIVGGGPTGVEFAGAFCELIAGPLARDFADPAPEQARVILLEATDRILGGMPEPLGDYALQRLRDMGIDVRLSTAVEEVGPDCVLLADGSRVEADTVVWTAGFRGSVAAERWGLPTGGGGRVPVRPTLQLEEHADVYVVGDLAHPGAADGEDSLPMVAPAAMQQGERAAHNILRELSGRELRSFRYEDPGMLATIGRNKAVARVFGRNFRGFPAWVLWVGVHIAKLIGFRNRLVVLINWAWDYLFYERAVRLILPSGGSGRKPPARSASGDRSEERPPSPDRLGEEATPSGSKTTSAAGASEAKDPTSRF